MSANGTVHGPDILLESDEQLANASAALERAWKEECAAAERLRDAQTAAAKAAHDLSIRQHERKRAAEAVVDVRKRRENPIPGSERSKPGVPKASPRKRFARFQAWLVASLVSVGACGFGYWAWAATGVRVCSTSMSGGAARDILSAYGKSHRFPYHYTLAQAGALPCDVRFYVATNADSGTLIARDGVVAIVNPSANIHELSASQLRDIFAGRIANWSKIGATPAPIVAELPPDGSDEARVAQALFNDAIAPSVRRSSASDIVKFIASPSGKNAIGFVPFSSAHDAKVVAIAGAPPPSASSIAHDRYPLSIKLIADSDFRHPNAGASGLLAFARSHDAHLVLARADLITKGTALPTGLGDQSR
jgi:hypothetical protein